MPTGADLSTQVAAGVAAFVALLLVTTPTFATLASSAYADLGLLFFTTVSLVALLRWSETEKTGLLALAGFAAKKGQAVLAGCGQPPKEGRRHPLIAPVACAGASASSFDTQEAVTPSGSAAARLFPRR